MEVLMPDRRLSKCWKNFIQLFLRQTSRWKSKSYITKIENAKKIHMTNYHQGNTKITCKQGRMNFGTFYFDSIVNPSYIYYPLKIASAKSSALFKSASRCIYRADMLGGGCSLDASVYFSHHPPSSHPSKLSINCGSCLYLGHIIPTHYHLIILIKLSPIHEDPSRRLTP